MTDHEYQSVNVKTVDLWLLLCACQLTQTSPILHEPLKAAYKDLGMRLQAVVLAIHPDAKPLCQEGWNRDSDYIEFHPDDPSYGPFGFQFIDDDEESEDYSDDIPY